MEEQLFELLVDGTPYEVRVTPFEFNAETRYKVKFNGSEEHIFTWDSSMKRLRSIDSASSYIPDNLEAAIAQKLESGNY